MKKDKTLYISDLDGTLLNGNAELSEYARGSITDMVADGICFSVATARTAATVLSILDGVKCSVPLVLLNGVLIYDAQIGKYVRVLPIPPESVTAIISVLKSLNVTGLMYQLKNDEQITYYETLDHKPIRDFVEDRIARYAKLFCKADSFADVPPECIVYFTFLDTHDKIVLAHDALSLIPGVCLTMYKDIYSQDLWYLEVLSEKATKQSGIEYLRETYGFDRIVGFGDNLNDLPLFAACDVRVAVENARDEVKAAADFVCDTNENNGVVKWIEERRNG